jgi:hypothetical protein
MNSKIIIIICLTLFVCGCGDHHPASEFTTSAFALHEDYDYWLSHGRPTDFQPYPVTGTTTNDVFVYTNIIKTKSAVFHCRIGARRPTWWPAGILAITDEGLVIFIGDKDGKVTISPETNGVDP